jgi:periplasmic copper chaperone A
MRIPWPAILGGTLLASLGAVGLIRGAVPVATAGSNSGSAPIVVTNAYVREPAPPTDAAAAYFTVYNTTAQDDTLRSVTSGAGATSVLHSIVDGQMTAAAQGAVIPAHGSLVLSTGQGHVIEQLFGKLLPGQTVNLELVFAKAGPIDITAPVIALGAPAPGGSSIAPTPASSGPTK